MEEIVSGKVAVGDEVKASGEAIDFLSNIGAAELRRCLLADSLVTLSEAGREVGQFSVTVDETSRGDQSCLVLHAHSHGAVDGTPCGTTITAYLSMSLETLEQEHHEYVKLPGHRLDRRCHIVQRDGQMMVQKVTAEGEEVKKQSVSYPLASLRGLVTEGSNLLLLRLLALRGTIPQHLTFISLDQDTQLSSSTYRELGRMQQAVGDEVVEVFGVERTVVSVADVPATWHSYFLSDGHLASRVQVGSPVTMKLLQMPARTNTEVRDAKPVFEKKPLVWEEDMQMYSIFLDRKEELKADHASYLKQHPELRTIMADYLQFLLLRKPSDVFRSTRDYFLPFSSRRPPSGTFNPSSS